MTKSGSVKERQTTHLADYDNSWYNPGSLVKRGLWSLVSALFFNHSLAVISSWKCLLLKMFGAKIGKGVVIKPSVTIKYPWFLSVGDYTWIGEKVWIDNLATVSIGNNVCISQGALLLTGNHNYKKATFDLMIGTIEIEDGVWLGAFSVVCGGVKCRSHSVLTVGSVAANDLEPYSIYRGNPVQKIKERNIQDT